MKKLIPSSALMIVLTAFLLSSCKKNDSAASSSAQLSFAMNTDNSASSTTSSATVVNNTVSTSAIALSGSNVTLTSGTANIAAFKLEAKKNGVSKEIITKNLTNVDLFALSQTLANTTIDTGTYKEVEIRVLLTKTTSTNFPLILKGYFTTKAGTQVPLEFDYNDDALLKAEAENVHVDGTQDLSTTVSLHLNKLLANITATDIDQTTRTNSTILISSTVNVSLYNKILVNFASSIGVKAFEKHNKTSH